MAAKKNETPDEVEAPVALDASGIPTTTASWVESEAGKAYLAAHDERQAAYDAEAKFLAESAAQQLPGQINTGFVEDVHEEAPDEPSEEPDPDIEPEQSEEPDTK